MNGKRLLRLALSLGLPLAGALPLHAATAGPVNVGYLVDEQFVHFDGNWQMPGQQNKVSDWEIDSKAGTLFFDYWRYATVRDTSPTGAITMRKEFLPQESGTVTADFRLALPVKIDGIVWAIRSGRDTDAVKFLTAHGDLGYEDGEGRFVPLVKNYAAGQAYTTRAVLNLDAHSADLLVDGARLATGVPFRNPAPRIDTIYISTSAAGTGDLFLYDVILTKGYLVNERFTCAKAGELPDGWTATTAGGLASPQRWMTATPKDPLSFRLDDTSATARATLSRGFPATAAKVVWEYKFLLPQKVDGATMRLGDGSGAAVVIVTAGGNIASTAPSGPPSVLWTNYKANLWYVVRAVADPATHRADLYVNGKLRASAVPFAAPLDRLDALSFSTPLAGTGTLWIDDVILYPFQPEPADYVPAPQPVTAGTALVGMQSFFSGWRPGQHCGWDWSYRFPNHDPYLGFYEEGNRETMDWELKWMAEAGIGFFLDCWYGYPTGNPMKQPLFESTQGALHEGYFYAKYSDRVKFAIADYSLGTVSSTTFRATIVPYWIEYYFKDPRYLKIDGKPVVAFGYATDWMKCLGVAGMRAEIDYLRAQLVAEGFPGAVILARYDGADRAVMNDLTASGIDACYAYTWGTNDIAKMQAQLTAERDAGSTLTPVAVSSQGWSGEAWDITTRGYTPLADFEAMNRWAKTTFMPSLPKNAVGRKMVLFANWNEYGEGHYICPTNLEGFGYLDKIRAVFAPGSQVTDTVPTAAQKARFNTLYARAWTGRSWNFDSIYPDTEGWTANGQVAGFAQDRGFLEGTITGNDSILLSPDGYRIDAPTYHRIKVRLRNHSAATAARFYFTTDSDGAFTEAKSVGFPLVANDPGYTEYAVEMAGNPAWQGKIRQLRFDPMNDATASGSFSIDFIKIVE